MLKRNGILSSALGASLALAGSVAASADIIAYRRGNFCVLVNVRNRAVSFTVSGFDVAGTYDVLGERIQRTAAVGLPAYGAVVLAR